MWQLANQNVLQQQHVDHKIANALLKKGTRDAYKAWNQQDRALGRRALDLHESHNKGGFGVHNNTITRHAASYILYDQRQVCCLRGHPPCSIGLAAGQRPPGSSHLGCPRSLHATASARRPPAALRLHRSAGSSTARPAVRRKRLRCCQRGRKPAVPARRIPGQQQRQTPSSAAQPPPRDIQAESGFPPGVFQLSGPAAHGSSGHSVATQSHATTHQAMSPIQGLASALHWHTF